ncbi:MAG: hypothetical protein JWO92_140 [Chitinophagaceae bacterium]|nr:hypothetical protein [Chitinophagaceae bacterium]MDB5222732.1 hypothetical protein [Chitinophagaceae bacterium]
MKYFVINLKSSLQRRKIMEDQLNKLNIPFEIFEAVKGMDLSEKEMAGYYEENYFRNRPGYFTPGAAGCAISHYLLYKKIVDEKIDVAIILEDDMILDKNFAEIADKVSAQIRNDEVILFFYQSYYKIPLAGSTVLPINKNFNLYQVVSAVALRSTGGYMIKYETAKSLLENLKPFSSFPDDWKSFYDRKIINGVRIVYPYVMTNSYEPTTISPYLKGGSLFRKTITFLEKHRIFPVYNFLKWRRKKYISRTRQCIITNEIPTDLRKN